MGKTEKTIFSLCLLITLVFLTVVVCWLLSRQSTNIEHIVQDVHEKTTQLEQHTEPKKLKKSLLQDQCQFGIDFVSDSSHLPTEVTKQRYRLPNHSSRNFTGTMLTQDLLCIDTMDAGEGKGVGIFECHGQGRNQAVTITTDGRLVTHAKYPMCISVKSQVSLNVVLKKCNRNDKSQKWTKDSIKGLLYSDIRKDFCMTSPGHEGYQVQIRACKKTESQKWRLVMNEVMLLLVEGAPTDPKSLKMKKSAKRHLSDTIQHAKHINTMEKTSPYLFPI